MKSVLLRLTAAASLLLVTLPTVAQVLDRPVAIVRLTETVNIGQRELRQQVELLEQQLGQTLTPPQRREVLEAQIGDVLLNQAAARANVRVSDEEIQQALLLQRQQLGSPVSDAQFRQLIAEQTGLSWEEYRNEVRNRLVQEQYILQTAQSRFSEIQQPTAREIRQVYEENAQQFTNPAMVRFDHLFFDLRGADAQREQAARQLARQFARDLERGSATFDELLRDSLDDTRYSGGDFGFILRGDPQAPQQLGATFVNTVFDLDEGDISGVLESNVGLHITRIADRRSPRLLGLDDPLLPGEAVTVRQQIINFITNRRQQQIFQQVVQSRLAELEEEADITRYPDNLDW